MAGVFVFSREVQSEDPLDSNFTQTAYVFAEDREEAETLLGQRLGLIQRSDDEEEEPEFDLGIGWRIDEYSLDESRVLTISLSQWPGIVPSPLP